MSAALRCEVLVIGSGPGGATTAALLAEAGRDVLLLEEGPDLPLESAPPFSLAEMSQKYRNVGLTPSFGSTRVTYLEGRCLGGASEINAALYHRPLPDVLDRWQSHYGIDAIDDRSLSPYLARIEEEFSVSRWPDGVGRASEHLHAAADRMGWKSSEIARFWKYTKEGAGWTGRRQSMTEVMIPRARRAGARVQADSRVERLVMQGARAVEAIVRHKGARQRVRFDAVFVCAGAVQTPLLLRRSGVLRNVGDSLTMNPMIRVAAVFDKPVNEPSRGVPVHQVEQFKPLMTLGCSHSSPPHLALWLAGMRDGRDEVLADWERMAIYYVKIGGAGRGRVRNIPVTGEAFVHMPITAEDLGHLGQGLIRLGELLFAGGAVHLFDPLVPGKKLASPKDLSVYADGVPKGNGALSAIHLHSTVPMGRADRGGATDSFGRIYELGNVRVNDSSLLPETPGINPQGLILAVARRNVERFLEHP